MKLKNLKNYKFKVKLIKLIELSLKRNAFKWNNETNETKNAKEIH